MLAKISKFKSALECPPILEKPKMGVWHLPSWWETIIFIFAEASGWPTSLCIFLSLSCDESCFKAQLGSLGEPAGWRPSFTRLWDYCTEVLALPQGEVLLHSGVIVWQRCWRLLCIDVFWGQEHEYPWKAPVTWSWVGPCPSLPLLEYKGPRISEGSGLDPGETEFLVSWFWIYTLQKDKIKKVKKNFFF